MSIQNTIREMLHRESFTPFRVVTTSGEAFPVHNPHLAVLMKSEIFIAQPDSDRWTVVPLLHVAAVDTLVNGSRRKRR